MVEKYTYPWDAAKEQTTRSQDKAAKRGATTAEKMISQAGKYAAENIKNVKLLGHVTQEAFNKPEASKVQAPQAPEQNKPAGHSVER